LCFEYSPAYGSAYLTRIYKPDGATLARYEYDFYTGLKTSATDPKGNVYHYEYDALGRETKEYLNDVNPDVAIMKTISYDDVNSKVTLRFGNSTKGFQEGLITYDSLFGKPTLIQRKINGNYVKVKEFVYDSNGRVAWEKDGLGHTTYHSYDALDRETQTKFPDNTSTNYSHNWEGNHRTVTITDANGHVKKQYFDLLDRQVKLEEHPDASSTVTTQYTYDTAGNLIRTSKERVTIDPDTSDNLAIICPNIYDCTNTYDNLGRLIRVDYPQSGNNPMAPETYEYDAAGNLWKKTTAKGTKVMEYEYNGGYRLKKVTEADGRVVNYTYDANDNLLTQTTDGVTYTYSNYDARNRARNFTATLDGQSFNFTYNYDTYGRMTGITYPNRTNPVTYTYDELDRLLTIPGFVDSCSYDENNQLKEMLYANGINNNWGYKATNGRLHHFLVGSFIQQQWATQLGGYGNNNKYAAGDFDGDGKSDLACVWNDNGQSSISVFLSTNGSFKMMGWAIRQGGYEVSQKWIAGDFNGDGKTDLANVFNDDGFASIDIHWSTGQSFGWERLVSQQGAFSDSQKWLTGDYNNDGKSELANIYNDNWKNSIQVHCLPKILNYGLSYRYDQVGNIIQINNDYYGYDGLNRLTWAGDSSNPRTGNGTAWTYDAAGNMTGKENYLSGISQGNISFTYDLANRLWSMGNKTYLNDNAGNRTGKTDTSAWGYIYDGENRLKQVTRNGIDVLDNTYDGAGMRIKEVKGGQTTYFVYLGNNPLLEYTPADGKYKYFIYAGNKMIAEEVDGVVKYYHSDHLGSTRLVTDAAGNVVASYKFKPYGETESYSGSF
ncbi:MAG: FG-GAP-like repeat-containing protein, partial [Firmicutes bacterium]|nr:FG-GAP-like repeat-containing protein [Bacillota bacterium]